MAVFFTRRGNPPSTGKQLSDYVEGDIVKIPENNTPVEFYVAKHNYESGLNGSGRTLMVRKDVYDLRSWNIDDDNDWINCTMRSWLNNTYKNLLDSNTRNLIDITTYYCTQVGSNWPIITTTDFIFLLSLTELGINHAYANTEGSSLPIANILKIAYKDGVAANQWTRTPRIESSYYAFLIYSTGNFTGDGVTRSFGSRPAFTLPSTTKFDSDTNIIIG